MSDAILHSAVHELCFCYDLAATRNTTCRVFLRDGKKTLLLEIFSNMNYEVLLRVGWSLERLAETAEEAIL